MERLHKPKIQIALLPAHKFISLLINLCDRYHSRTNLNIEIQIWKRKAYIVYLSSCKNKECGSNPFICSVLFSRDEILFM
jgi:hypothetical protein